MAFPKLVLTHSLFLNRWAHNEKKPNSVGDLCIADCLRRP
jgi:hypothetical protein